MSSLAKGCLELARQRRETALETHFGTRVKELRPKRVRETIVGWDILDKDGKTFGAFDWVVMAGATPALSRWRDGFKEEPPVYAAAQATGSQLFRNLVAHLDRPLPYEQTHVVMLAWGISTGGETADSVIQCLRQLPFDITQVNGDEALAKVTLQSAAPPYATIVLHSTPTFARRHKKVMGSGSYVSVANNVEGSVDAEAAVGEELFRSFRTLLEKLGCIGGGLHSLSQTWDPLAVTRLGCYLLSGLLLQAPEPSKWIVQEITWHLRTLAWHLL
eukprot:TRINITY_DN58906_c0_g1_i1.p1 TRINITY_DN58906_c0_g1~~TRINITY_DN58906_c0_g1_i1.p1  ORF type:complete len:295 (-),score=32.34 TRINITY_DN58906_c0_g1_i1:23-844(-)